MKTITIEVELNDAQAWALAQFVKRVGLSDYRALAIDQDEAYEMVDAGERVRRALAEKGRAPRGWRAVVALALVASLTA